MCQSNQNQLEKLADFNVVKVANDVIGLLKAIEAEVFDANEKMVLVLGVHWHGRNCQHAGNVTMKIYLISIKDFWD